MRKRHSAEENARKDTKEPFQVNTDDLGAKLNFVFFQLDFQIEALEQQKKHHFEKVASLIKQATEAQSRNDLSRACVFSCELAEEYKITKLIIDSKLTLEMVRLKLGKASDIEVDELRVAIGVLSKIAHRFIWVHQKPEAKLDPTIQKLNETLGVIAADRKQNAENVDCEAIDKEVEKILTETAEIASRKMKTEYDETLNRCSKPKTENNT
jgi:division protein CdvB (Snf7/Vps24/ESCRT-III family)